ncbi:cysteine proteinase [Auriscalpium vulgare]|uniref:Cysteine proteinase n=1 Tax=Auriscalpium vulgare TaxID=40419 RepID=A0ACB8RKX4_9AGAM|nr:cysteine proteinase [Auriscalpium vulgare]
MAAKRPRRVGTREGLLAGERLKRQKLATEEDWDTGPWGWVGTEVTDASLIGEEHRLATCGMSKRSAHPFCANKYRRKAQDKAGEPGPVVHGELADDVIVISDDESPSCSKRACAKNPNCLNYLGQEKWEDEEGALKAYMAAANLGSDPRLENRNPAIPVGLRNLGATCYANAYIQVWFQDIPFRNGVYQCQPSQDKDHSFEESPIFQLQATFAALQESKTKVFNPVKLVESLKLRTNEQQDAQEFSKLFMSHLDTEFQKQSDPNLKHLLSQQFQGKQAYATTCMRCGNRSENESDFLEIEVNLENNSSLESRIQAVLEPETLSGDNKYRCPRCDSLEDATRQLVLRKLPPVLHFSLLRFVFDVATLERKKSKHMIKFPTTLDMGQFMGPDAGECVYELQGILVHKGPSAYHGHYEALVLDHAHEEWFRFNDEVVTKMDPRASETMSVDSEQSKPNKPRAGVAAKKRRRVEDSDDEARAPSAQDPQALSSKDAYMLVYTRRGSTHKGAKAITPPQRAHEAVSQLNAAHEDACNTFHDNFDAATDAFRRVRQMMMDFYRSWTVSSNDETCIVISQQALKTFISLPFSKLPEPDVEDSRGVLVVPESSPMRVEVSNSDIFCLHNCLDPHKASDMKRISYQAYREISSERAFRPVAYPKQVCARCVRKTFTEKLYRREHPEHVAQFEAVVDDKEYGPTFWISKAWLKDWKQAKPKMHEMGEIDPAPDSDPFRSHVYCEHGGLVNNITSRLRISQKAYALLQSLFPEWQTLSDEYSQCEVCDMAVQLSKNDSREMRKRAEDEKAKLKHMSENAHNGNTALLEDVPCALIPAAFVRAWKLWILRPAGHTRPERLDNSPFICEHGLLVLDPNAGDLDKAVCNLVRMHDWRLLETLYDAGPLIQIENRTSNIDYDWAPRLRFVHEPAVCEGCRIKRKSDYDVTEITVRILDREEPDPNPSSAATAVAALPPRRTPLLDGQTSIVTYRSRNANGGPQRQSQRLRSLAKRKELRLGISKDMSVKDLKLLLQDELSVPTICQRIFYKGHELLDNSATAASLEILVDDVLDFREVKEDEELLEDSDVEVASRKREADGGGFGGTLLGGDAMSDYSVMEDTATERSSSPVDTSISCPACTFKNPAGASTCEICDTRI